MPFIFDGHNDLLGSLWLEKVQEPGPLFREGRANGHLDLPRMREGGMLGGFCALWAPSDPAPTPDGRMSRENATIAIQGQISLFNQIIKESDGAVLQARTVQDLRSAIGNGQIAFVLHLEGCEGISEDLSELQGLYDQGLRGLGPVWNEPTRFGYGAVPDCPSSPDTGPGLTDAGKRLLAECNRLGIMFDLSHLNEKGFWDVAELSTKPLVATHSNAHALCPHSRNLTDAQLRAIGKSGGVVGINFASAFLHPQGIRDRSIGLAPIVEHFKYITDLIGIDHVAFGSDFDGAVIPDAIGGADLLPTLTELLAKAGFSEAEMRKLRHENWFRVLSKIWAA